MALQWRLGVRARTTQDGDLLLTQKGEDLHALLVQGALHDLRDGFAFEVQPSRRHPGRFTVHCFLAGRRFESFHVDVGTEDVLTLHPERLTPPSLLAFAGIEPTPVWVYPVAQQIAEKVHAYTYPYPVLSRVKDWVDLALLATLGEIQAAALRQALEATFAHRDTHPLPRTLPPPPPPWWTSSRRLRRKCGLVQASLEEMHRAIAAFLDPLLQARVPGHRWRPERGVWVL